MSKVTRRDVMRVGVAAGAVLGAGTACAQPEKENPLAFVDRFLPPRLTKEDIQAAKSVTFTKLEFAKSVFWVGIFDLPADSVSHASIGIYAADREGVFHRCLLAESWAAGKIEAAVDARTGLLELRERANSELKGQLVLSCNLKTIGTQHSVAGK
jgi:hypothetical protein